MYLINHSCYKLFLGSSSLFPSFLCFSENSLMRIYQEVNFVPVCAKNTFIRADVWISLECYLELVREVESGDEYTVPETSCYLYLLIHKANISISSHDPLLSTYLPSESSGESAKNREDCYAPLRSREW